MAKPLDADLRDLSCGDVRVAYREWPGSEPNFGPSPGARSQPGWPVVLIHGNWSTHRWWIPTAHELSPRLPQHRLIAYDLRGRGASEGPDHGYTIPELADDLAALLDGLGLDRVHLVGHSLGTGIAMDLALRAPERVASMVLVAPVWVDGMPERWARREDQAQLHADRDRFARLLAGMAPAADHHSPLWAELVTTGHRQRPIATSRNLDALIAWRPGDALRAASRPRLVVDGELDKLCGGPTAARAAAALACPRVSIAGIGHAPNLEAPDRLAAIVRRVVREVEWWRGRA